MFLLILQLFNQLKSSPLIVPHILVPCFAELRKLQLLRILNVKQLLLLGESHVLLLALLLGLAEFVELAFHHLGAAVVTSLLGGDAKVVHDPNIGIGVLSNEGRVLTLGSQGPYHLAGSRRLSLGGGRHTSSCPTHTSAWLGPS